MRCIQEEGGMSMRGMVLETAFPRRVLPADDSSLADAGVASGEMLNVVKSLL